MGHTTHNTLTRARGDVTLDHDAIAAHAVWLGADAATAARAAEQVLAGRVVLLAVNGWMGSGKDTIAPAVLDHIGVPAEQRVHAFFAHQLKAEVDHVLELMTAASSVTDAAATVTSTMGIPASQGQMFAERLWDTTRPGHDLTAYSRTPEIRWALQQWGTEVRRSQDPNYWVKAALQPLIEQIADGKSVYITDARFPNEVTASQALGMQVVRLEITRETQRRRLMTRDGLTEEQYQSATGHASETSLDDFEDFDLVLDNNGDERSIPAIVKTVTDTLFPSPPAPAPVALAWIVDANGRVLHVRRSRGDTAAGSWGLIGGGIGPGEVAAQAVAREVREETGLAVHAQETLAQFDVPEWDVRVHLVRACLPEGATLDDASLNTHEVDAIAWLAPEAVQARPDVLRSSRLALDHM